MLSSFGYNFYGFCAPSEHIECSDEVLGAIIRKLGLRPEGSLILHVYLGLVRQRGFCVPAHSRFAQELGEGSICLRYVGSQIQLP